MPDAASEAAAHFALGFRQAGLEAVTVEHALGILQHRLALLDRQIQVKQRQAPQDRRNSAIDQREFLIHEEWLFDKHRGDRYQALTQLLATLGQRRLLLGAGQQRIHVATPVTLDTVDQLAAV